MKSVMALPMILLVAVSGFAASPNDPFSARHVLSGLPVSATADFRGATREEGEPHGEGASLWWEWTATLSGGVGLEVTNPSWPPKVIVYRGDTFGTLERVSEPVPDWQDGRIQGYNRASFRATEGTRYVIAVAGSTNTTVGMVRLSLRAGPSNDDLAEAIELSGPVIASSASLLGATVEPTDPVLIASSAGASVWWKWNPGEAGRYLVTAGNIANALAAYRIGPGGLLEEVGRGVWRADRVHSRMIVNLASGDPLYLLVTDRDTTLGTVMLRTIASPVNDDFSNALELEGPGATVTFNMTGATREAGEPPGHDVSVWFKWTATEDRGMAVQATGTAPGVVVYQGDSVTTLERVSTPPRLGAEPFGIYQSPATFRAKAGQTYAIAVVGSEGLNSGTTVKLLAGPANDDFRNAMVISGSVLRTSTLTGATSEEGEEQYDTNSLGASVWWSWTAVTNGGYGFAASAPTATVSLMLYRVEEGGGLSLVRADRDGDGTGARVNLRATEGERYYIRVADWLGGSGMVSLTVGAAPPNNDLANALEVSSLLISGTSAAATPEPGDPVEPGSKGNTVWYRWTPAQSGGYELRLTNPVGNGDNAGSVVKILAGSGLGEWTTVASATSGFQTEAQTTLWAAPGQSYYIMVDGRSDGGNPFTITFTRGAGNDSFAGRQSIAEGNAVTISTVAASVEPGEPPVAGSRTLWWEFVPEESGGYYVEYGQPEVGRGITIYTGTSLSELQEVESEAVFTTMGGYHRFRAVAGERYQIRYHDSVTRTITMRVERAPANDDFAERVDVDGNSAQGTTYGATREEGEPPSVGTGSTVWYRWQAPSEGTWGIVANNALVEVYRGAGLAELRVATQRFETETLRIGVVQAAAGEEFQIAVDTLSPGVFEMTMVRGPENDNLAQRSTLVEGTNTIVNMLATIESGEPERRVSSKNQPVKTVWYEWETEVAGGARLMVRQPARDSMLVVYREGAQGELFIEGVAESDGLTLDLPFYALPGHKYVISYGQFDPGVDAVTLVLSRTLASDSFEGAEPLELGEENKVIVRGATLEPGETGWAVGRGTVWLEWTAPTNGTYRFDLEIGEADAGLAVFTGNSVTELTPVNMVNEWGGYPMSIAWRALEGVKYYIAIAVRETWVPEQEYTVILQPGHAADDFANAIELSGLYVQWMDSNAGATTELGEVARGGDTNRASVWATWVAPETGTYRVSNDSMLSFYEGTSLETLTAVAARKPLGYLEWEAEAGERYYLRADSAANQIREFAIRLGKKAVNETMATAIPVAGEVVEGNGATWTLSAGTLRDPPAALWWRWTAPRDGMALLTTAGTLGGAKPSLQMYHDQRPTLSSNALYQIGGRVTPLPVTNRVVVTGGVEYFIGTGGQPATNAAFALSLDGLEELGSRWTTALPGLLRGGNTAWSSQDSVVKLGPDALTISVTNQSQVGWIEAIFERPGTLTFWRKNTGSRGIAVLNGANDGLTQPLAPAGDWALTTLLLNRPTNTVRIQFGGGGGIFIPRFTPGQAWIDGITFTPKPPARPRFTAGINPVDRTLGMSFPVEAGMEYEVEYTTNLVDWLHWTNVNTTAFGTRFFRWPVEETEGGTFFRAVVK